MPVTIAVIAPLIDENQFNIDYTVKVKDTGYDLSLSLLYDMASGQDNRTVGKLAARHEDDIPAAGFYLESILRMNGFEPILTNKFDTDTLKKLAEKNVIAICLSTTMILTTQSFLGIIGSINKELPGVPVISGGMFLWKQYLQLNHHLQNKADYPISREFFFHPSNAYKNNNVLIVAEHGVESLLHVLRKILNNTTSSIYEVPNLCLQDSGEFRFTARVNEVINYNSDYTKWDFVAEMPAKIPVRTSVGCHYRCGYCDFCKLFPKIFLRSADSLKAELKLIRDRLNGSACIIHVTDDNVFLNSARLFEICSVFSSSGLANWICFMRGREYTPEELKAIQFSGLRMGMIGVESGDQGQLDRMKKKLRVEDVKRGAEQLDDIGVTVLMTFVVGYPGESAETLDNTIRFLNDLRLSNLFASYHVYPLYINLLAEINRASLREKWNIRGIHNNWSHYTMNSSQAVDACNQVFRNVTNLSYHYPAESHFFNKGMFSRQTLGDLFRLRQMLTLEVMNQSSWEVQHNLLRKMISFMGQSEGSIIKLQDNLVV